MISNVIAIILAIGSLFSFIYGLIHGNKALELKNSWVPWLNKTQEWADKIDAVDRKVKEDERDYEDSKKRFNDTNNPPSGAV